MRRIPAGALALALISSLAITPSVAAKPPLVLDQAAESPGDLYRFQWSQGSANAAGLAQTLTVGQTGVLEAVELVLSREDWTTQDLTIAIRGDAPNGPWLATSEPVPAASVPVYPVSDWVRFTFPAPTPVTAGQAVAIVTPLPDPAWADSDPAWFWAWSQEDYVSGVAWDGYWWDRWANPVESWAEWWDGSDRTFRTYVREHAGHQIDGFVGAWDGAIASFWFQADECLGVQADVTLVVGERGANLGDGRPWTWSDVSVVLNIWETCQSQVLYTLSGWVVVPEPDLTPFESASLGTLEIPLADESGTLTINAVVDNLAWIGNDEAPDVQIGNEPGSHTMTRVVNAQLTGSLAFSGGNVSWPNQDPMTSADAGWTVLLRWSGTLTWRT